MEKVFKIGDFYEIFGNNAPKLSDILDLTLTSRDVGTPYRQPMIGFPYHVKDKYIDKILNNSGVNKNKYGDFAKGLIVRELVNDKGSVFFFMNTSEEEQDLTIGDNKIQVPAKKNGYIKLI